MFWRKLLLCFVVAMRPSEGSVKLKLDEWMYVNQMLALPQRYQWLMAPSMTVPGIVLYLYAFGHAKSQSRNIKQTSPSQSGPSKTHWAIGKA